MKMLALELAIKSFLSSNHSPEDYGDILEVMQINDDEGIRRLGIITWLPFESYTYAQVAEYIERQAELNYKYFLRARTIVE
jgi:hypothetical protein